MLHHLDNKAGTKVDRHAPGAGERPLIARATITPFRRILTFPLTRILLAAIVFFALQIAIGIGSQFLPAAWQGPLLTQGLSLAAALAVFGLITRVVERSTFADAGLTRHGLGGGTAAGFAVGAALIGATVGVMALFGWYQVAAAGWVGSAELLRGLALFLLVAVAEELVFRGLLFRIVEEGIGTWLALVVVALIFGAVHLANDNATLLGALGTGLAGVLLSAAFVLTRNLWLAIGIHWSWNLSVGTVFGLPVSGRDAGASFFAADVHGPSLWTGGAFGLEAGAVSFLVTAAASALLLAMAVRRGKLVTPQWLRPRRITVLLASVLVGSAAAQGAVPSTVFPVEAQGAVDAFVKERMAAAGIPGLSLVIVQGGQVAYTQGYGLANVDEQVPMEACTPVGPGSTTKSLTALAIMQLVEGGELDLEAAVVDYIPWFAGNREHVGRLTVRHALAMTTGLQDWMDTAVDASGIDASQLGVAHSRGALEQRVRSMADLTPIAAPGEKWAYSSTGYTIAGLLIEAVTGMPYEDYMQQRVFAPLGMTSTAFGAVEGAAQGYLRSAEGLRAEPTLQAAGYRPAGLDVFSSACDYGNYLTALLAGGSFEGHRIVSQPSIDAMWTPDGVVHQQQRYGMGWYVQDWSGVKVVNHGGHAMVSGSAMFVAPELGVAVAVLANVDDVRVDAIGQALFENLTGVTAVVKRPASTFEPDRSVWERYVGSYETSMGVPLRVFVEGLELKAIIEGPGIGFTLEAFSDTEFVTRSEIADADNADAVFLVDEDGTVRLFVAGQEIGVKAL